MAAAIRLVAPYFLPTRPGWSCRCARRQSYPLPLGSIPVCVGWKPNQMNLHHRTAADPAADPPAEMLDIPDSWWLKNRHVALWLLVAGGAIVFLRWAAEAVVPFVLSGILFYALDPAVDAMQRRRIPRVIGAALMLGMVVGSIVGGGYVLRDDIVQVVTELPDGARRLRAGDASPTRAGPSTVEDPPSSYRRARSGCGRSGDAVPGPGRRPARPDSKNRCSAPPTICGRARWAC